MVTDSAETEAVYKEERLHSWLKYMYTKHRDDLNHRWLTYDIGGDEFVVWHERPPSGLRVVATTVTPRHAL